MRSIDGACASSLDAFAPSACAIGPLRWALAAGFVGEGIETPKVDGPSCRATTPGGAFLLRQAEAGLQELGDFLLLAGFGFEADKQCMLDHADSKLR